MLTIMGPVMVLFGLLGAALVIIPFWVIFKKAGLGGPLSLLMLIPLVGIVMLYVLAFSRWKVVPVPEYGMGYPPPGYPALDHPAGVNQQAYPIANAAPPAYVPPPQDSSRF